MTDTNNVNMDKCNCFEVMQKKWNNKPTLKTVCFPAVFVIGMYV